MYLNAVEPVRDRDLIQDIAQLLKSKNERDYVLFMCGLYLGRRISDMLPLKVKDVRDKEFIYFRESKKNKEITITINKDLKKILKDYCKGKRDYEYLFKRSRGKENKPISRQRYWKILNDAAKELGYEEKIGCHSMRKSLGYWLYQNGVDPYKIMLLLNHEDINYTKRYIGVTRDDINDVLKKISFI